jgi:NADH:ubiquinone oxidoreductase subunit 5 (subunit L)/multisubunit Na+/H+ antiporter MnhA subunit
MLLYGLDLAHLVAFNERLQPGIFQKLRSGGPDTVAFQRNAPWVMILLLAAAGTAFIYFVLVLIHNFVRNRKRLDDKRQVPAKGLTALFLLLAVWGSFSGMPLSVNRINDWKDIRAVKATINPFESLFFPLPKK